MKILPYVVFFAFFIFLTCRKEPEANVISGCLKDHLALTTSSDDPDYNCCDCSTEWEEIYSSEIPYDYLFPQLSPNDNNQIAFYRHNNSQIGFTGYEIWIVNFCTNERKKIVSNALFGMSWSKDDWIYYTAVDKNIYRIKSNGGHLTQVTFTTGAYNRYPVQSPSGNKLMYQVENKWGTNLLIENFASGIIDTIKKTPAISTWTWLDDDRVFYTELTADNVQSLFTFNTLTKEKKKIHELSLFSTSGLGDSIVNTSIFLLKENSILWCADKLVGKTNLDSGHFSIILTALKQEQFIGLCGASDQASFVLNKRVKHQVDNCHVDSDFDFYFINKGETKQEKIIL